MPSTSKWIGQFLLAASTMFALILALDMIGGGSFSDAWVSSLIFAIAAAAIFTVSRYNRARSGNGRGSLGDKWTGKK